MLIIAIIYCWFGLSLPVSPDISESKIQNINKSQSEKSGILVPIIIHRGEKMDFAILPEIILYAPNARPNRKNWNYIRRAVYTCYPYLKTLLATLKDLQDSSTLSTNALRRKFIRQKERELRQEFSARVRNMTLYEGKVLLKLLYRSTQKTGYTLLKETRGGFMAGIYQGLAKVFGGSLKYTYDPKNDPEDQQIEAVYIEVENTYGF